MSSSTAEAAAAAAATMNPFLKIPQQDIYIDEEELENENIPINDDDSDVIVDEGVSVVSDQSSSSSSSQNHTKRLYITAVLTLGIIFGVFAAEMMYTPITGGEGGDAAMETLNVMDEENDKTMSIQTTSSTSMESFPPSLSELVKDHEVVGDISWLLDFAVVDFPKSGTTFLMHYLMQSEEIDMNAGELCSVSNNEPLEIVERFYPHPSNRTDDDVQTKKKNGLKCPKDLESKFGLRNYAKVFPRTKFIITTRHPVWWFQSYYNFRVYKHYPRKMPSPNELVGHCRCRPYVDHCDKEKKKGMPNTFGVCTDRARYHHAISRLGKTEMKEEGELELLRGREMEGGHGENVNKNQVFLLEIGQLIPDNQGSEHFADDMKKFLGLESDLPVLVPFSRPDKYSDEVRREGFMNICAEEYVELRRVLVEHGRDAARWIEDYFINSHDVVVSYQEKFLDLIREWGRDPCQDDPERWRRYLEIE